jgi:hypothetical protein
MLFLGIRAGNMRKIAFFIVLALLAGGCGGPSPRKFVRPNIDLKNYRRVAVLPIDNFTPEKYAGEKIRQAVMTELLARGVDIVEPGEVNNALVKMQVQSLRTLTREQLKELGKELNVNTVMTGSVGAYATKKGVRVSYPEVSINLMAREVSSGQILWSVWHATGGPTFWTKYFGTEGKSLNEAAREIVHEAVRSYH